MNKKNHCSKCGEKRWSVSYFTKKDKTKYYWVCDNCKKKRRFYPKGIAYDWYCKLCEYETAVETKNYHGDKRFVEIYYYKLGKLQKEYKYVYHNLIILFEYIFKNNCHVKFEKVRAVDLVNITKNYKSPLTDKQCLSILNEADELLKYYSKVSEEKQ